MVQLEVCAEFVWRHLGARSRLAQACCIEFYRSILAFTDTDILCPNLLLFVRVCLFLAGAGTAVYSEFEEPNKHSILKALQTLQKSNCAVLHKDLPSNQALKWPIRRKLTCPLQRPTKK
ncbi:hypothetical protein NDU88_009522 [Pleurodeles waltl]|uniref:Uncharacterized protein n=1 Tax=Pleurodeles waltl TaxID=8319 RepID=A0AAV7PSG0_PLEWA|nr:hypothetical protein NDU88_009522 [Pleurodeles waltl]